MSESTSDSPAGLQAPKPPALDDPGPITRRVMQVNVAHSNVRMHALISDPALWKYDIFIFSDPWWGKIGNARNDDDPFKHIYGSPATREWNIFLPPIDTQKNHPSVAVYVKKGRNITAEVIPDAPATRYYFTMNIRIGQLEFHLIPVYFHGKNHSHELRNFMSLPLTAQPTLICGDFNAQHSKLAGYEGAKVTSTAIGNEFMSWIEDNDLSVHNDLAEVTRIASSGNSASILDYTIANALLDSYDIISDWDISFPLSLGSDHGAITFRLRAHGPIMERETAEAFIIDGENKKPWVIAYKSYMSDSESIEEVQSTDDIEKLAQAMLDSMRKATSDTMELRKTSGGPPRAPWWSEECTHACADVVHARKVGNSPAECKALMSHLWYCIRTAKKKFYEKICSEASPDNIWDINQWYKGRKTYALPTLRRPDGTLAITSEQKAEVLHRTFFPPAPHPPVAASVESMPQRPLFEFPSISKQEIADNLEKCHNKSAPGAFGTNYRALKWAFKATPSAFVKLFNACLEHSYHPTCFRAALIAPIPKPNKHDRTAPKSYRPIALLETLSKLLEKIVAKRLTTMCGKLNLIRPEQFGGRDKSSCLDAGLSLIHDVHAAQAQKLSASIALMDISGYFNNIDHMTLTRIMTKLGFPEKYVKWLTCYLSDRKAVFRINGEVGNFFDLQNKGIPQGSPLSPIISSIYSTPLLQKISDEGIRAWAYIDDILILTTGASQEICIEKLQDDITTINEGLSDLGLWAENEKTELLHFAKGPHDMTKNLPLRMGDRAQDIVHPAGWVRWLGFFLDRRLNFKTHITKLATRAKSVLGGMQMLANTVRGLDVCHARTLVIACIMPILTYGSALWIHGRNARTHCKTLQVVQNTACRWITGSFRTAPTAALEHIAAIPPIAFRIKRACANYASKLRHLPAKAPVVTRLPPTFDTSRPEVAHPTPLSPINALANYTHPNAEFRTPYLILPWEGLKHLSDQIEITKSNGASSKEERKAYARGISQRLWEQEEDPHAITLFADGSSFVKNGSRKTGWGWVSYTQGMEVSRGGGALGPRATIYDAEAWALLLGLRHVLPYATRRGLKVVHILVDNAGLLQALLSRDPIGAPAPVDLITRCLIDFLKAHPEASLELTWVPAHQHIFGNERADRIAKAAAIRTPTPFFNRTTDYIKYKARKKLCKDWSQHWQQFRRTHPNAAASDHIRFPPRIKLHPFHKNPKCGRKLHAQLIRAITGHGRHGAYLFKIGSADTPGCHCGAPIQDIAHLFVDCPKYKRARKFLRGFSRTINLSHVFSDTEGLKAALKFLGQGNLDI
jgi:ribonuclease HI